MSKKAVLLLVISGFILAAFLLGPLGVSWWVFQNIEKTLKMPVQGSFEPQFGRSSFTIRDAALEWDGKVRLESADIQVHYELSSLFGSSGMRLQLNGQDFPVVLLGDLARFSPKSNIRVSDFYADLIIGSEGLQEVSALRVQSPEFQFQIGPGS